MSNKHKFHEDDVNDTRKNINQNKSVYSCR